MAEEAPLCTLPSTDREYAFLLIAIKNVNLTYYIINITMKKQKHKKLMELSYILTF